MCGDDALSYGFVCDVKNDAILSGVIKICETGAIKSEACYCKT